MTKLGLTPGVHGADNDEKNEDKKEDIKIDPKVFTVLQPTVIPVPTPVKQKSRKRSSSLCCYISKCLAIFALFVLLFATAMVIIYGADTVLQYFPSIRSTERQSTKPSIEALKTGEQPKEDSNLMMMSIPLARFMVIDGGREDSQEQNSQQNTESQETAQVPEGRPRHPYEIEGPPMHAFNMPPTSEQSQQEQQPNPLIQMFQQRLMAQIMMARMMRFRRIQQAMYEQEMMQRQAMEARWRMQQEMQQMMMARTQWAEQMRMQEMARAQQAYAEQQRQQWEAMQAQRQEAERQRAIMYWQQQQMQQQSPQVQNQQQQQGPVGWWQTPNPSQNGWQNVPRPFMNPQGPPSGFMRPHDASPQQIVDRLAQPKPFGENSNMQTIPPIPLPSIQDRIYQHYQQQAQNMHFDAPNRPIWTAITPTPPTPVVDGEKTTVIPNANATENVFKPFESKITETATEAPPVIVFQDDFPKTNERTTTPEPKLNEKAPKSEEDHSEELIDIPTLFNRLFNGQLQRLAESKIIDNTPADQIMGETKDSSEAPPPQEPKESEEEESPLPSPSVIPAVAPTPTESGEEEGKSMETPMGPSNGGGSSEVAPSVVTPEEQPGSTEVAPEVSPSEEASVSVDESEPNMRRLPPHAITV